MVYPKIYLKTTAEWREWLEENHKSVKGIWLIYFKKHTRKSSVPYNEAVEEALCFGWIDSTVKRIDEERYMQQFTPRLPKSNWSPSNKKRVEKLTLEGKMTEAGLRLAEIAKQNGKWDEETNAQKDYTISEELMGLLKANLKAFAEYLSIPPSHRKQYAQWIMSAKRSETRERRMKEMIRVLEAGEKMKMM